MSIRGKWDDPKGLGWQVWRRAQSTGLIAERTRTQLARRRIGGVSAPHALAADIRRRWGIGSPAAWHGGDLPLFAVHFAGLAASRWQHGPPAARETARHPTIAGRYVTGASPALSVGRVEPAPGAPTVTSGSTIRTTVPPLSPAGVPVSASRSRPPGSAVERSVGPRSTETGRVSPKSSAAQRRDSAGDPLERPAGIRGAAQTTLVTPAAAAMVASEGSHRGTTILSRAVGAPLISSAAVLPPVWRMSPSTGDRAVWTPWRFSPQVSLSTVSTAREHEVRHRAPWPSTDASPGPGDQPADRPSADVLAGRPPNASVAGRVSRATFANARLAQRDAGGSAIDRGPMDSTLRSAGAQAPAWAESTSAAGPRHEDHGRSGQQSPEPVLTVRDGMAVSRVARHVSRFADPTRAEQPGRAMEVGGSSLGGLLRMAFTGSDRPSIGPSRTARLLDLFRRSLSPPRVAEATGFGVSRPWVHSAPAGPGGMVRAPVESTEPGLASLAFGDAAEGWMERATAMGRLDRLVVDAQVPRSPMTDSGQLTVVAATTFGVRRPEMGTTEVGSPEPSTVVVTPMAGRGVDQVVKRAVPDVRSPEPSTVVVTPMAGRSADQVVERAVTEVGSPEPSTVVRMPMAGRLADQGVERAITEVGSSEFSTVVGMPMAGRRADPVVERPITRSAVPARGIGAIPLVAHAENAPGGLLLHRSRLPFPNLARPRDALWRYGGPLATPALPIESADARSESVGRPSDIGTPADMRPIDSVAQGWRPAAGPVGTGRSPWSMDLATALTPIGSVTISRLALGPANAPWGERHGAPGPAPTGGHELLFAVRPAESARVTAVQRTSEFLVQAAPAPIAAVAHVPAGPRQDVRAGEAPAGASNRPIDLDELVDRAWQKLMRKVSIEQERRGYARWDWQS
jgi:hypothetical protein